MGKITTLQYAQMAEHVYYIDCRKEATRSQKTEGKSWVVGGFKAELFEYGMGWGGTSTDFKGCVYASRSRPEAVVALQGTVPAKAGDLVADLQIALGGLVGMLPQYCTAALKLFEKTLAIYPSRNISFVGHSLGGAIAQVMGHWTGLPFVTFNAPGMWGDIQKSKVVMAWSPKSSLKSIAGTFKGSLLSKQMASTGRNFRNALDPVSAYGFHYGPVTRFWGMGIHSMEDLLARIKDSKWANINPFDPAYKEWGEL